MLLPLFPSSTSSPAFRPLLALLPYLYLIPLITRTIILTLTLFCPTSSYVFTSLRLYVFTSLRLLRLVSYVSSLTSRLSRLVSYVSSLRLVSPTTSLLIPVIPLSRLYTLVSLPSRYRSVYTFLLVTFITVYILYFTLLYSIT
jgi:hypothetical protein